ncbi:MAG: DNA primase catalytic subunit PriS, partial [Candidatus Bathyarchaeia archaeon]
MGSAEDPDQLARSAVKSKFQEYYRKNSDSIFPPSSMEKREFGFLVFTEGVMIRHRSFRNVGDLRMFIQETAPSDVYYSAAYYEDPEAPMDKKGWSGSDLIFDIDADHIETPCKQTHDRWLCIGCRF